MIALNNTDITTGQDTRIINAISELVDNVGLDDVKTVFDSKTGTASISGNKNGIQYTTTLARHKEGLIQTSSRFSANIGRDALKQQIIDLKKQGYTQSKIGDMLGISQPTVHNYLKR